MIGGKVKRGRRAGQGVLVVVALLLVASAAARIGAGPGAAIARELALETSTEKAAETYTDDITPELISLLQDVKKREAKVKLREAEIEARMQVLSLVEEEVASDIDRLEAADATLRATMSAANQAAETDLMRLTAVYENMKSEQAANLFQRMKPSFAAGFLGRMRPDAAAAILAGLEPELAYSISVVLAGRNANVPVEQMQ
ncbi:MAG: MotE family protein [Boseongicola sp.]